MIKSQITLLWERVLRTIFKARANPADDLWAKMAIRIKTAASVLLMPRAVPRKKDGTAIIQVMMTGIMGELSPPISIFLECRSCSTPCSMSSNKRKAEMAMTDANGKSSLGNAWRKDEMRLAASWSGRAPERPLR